MFDMTQSYTLSFVVGGVLCIASAIIMIHPYFYVKKHLQDIALDIPEKEALASSVEFSESQFPSILNVSKMAVSLEVIPAIHKLSSLSDVYNANAAGSLDALPVNKRIRELRSFQSTASV